VGSLFFSVQHNLFVVYLKEMHGGMAVFYNYFPPPRGKLVLRITPPFLGPPTTKSNIRAHQIIHVFSF
jgi:hypothetical protein